MTQTTPQKRCLATILGLTLVLIAVICLAGMLIGQRLLTGEFTRGDGFQLGWVLAWPMFGSLVGGLALLIAGGFVDSIRSDRRKRAENFV